MVSIDKICKKTNKDNSIDREIHTVRKMKFYTKFALTHGAYSVKNKDRHMMRHGKNYNQKEKVIAEINYIYGAIVGEKVQDNLLDFIKNNEELLIELRMKYPELYQELAEVIRQDEQGRLHDGSSGREEKA